MPKKYIKRNGPDRFVHAWLSGTVEELSEAFRKEASREVAEMLKWMEFQKSDDPDGAFVYEDNIFPMIIRAKQLRGQLYDKNKKIPPLEFKILQASHAFDQNPTVEVVEEFRRLETELLELDAERVTLCWKIKALHIKVKRLVMLDVQTHMGDVNPFEEYEYDPEVAG